MVNECMSSRLPPAADTEPPVSRRTLTDLAQRVSRLQIQDFFATSLAVRLLARLHVRRHPGGRSCDRPDEPTAGTWPGLRGVGRTSGRAGSPLASMVSAGGRDQVSTTVGRKKAPTDAAATRIRTVRATAANAFAARDGRAETLQRSGGGTPVATARASVHSAARHDRSGVAGAATWSWATTGTSRNVDAVGFVRRVPRHRGWGPTSRSGPSWTSPAASAPSSARLTSSRPQWPDPGGHGRLSGRRRW